MDESFPEISDLLSSGCGAEFQACRRRCWIKKRVCIARMYKILAINPLIGNNDEVQDTTILLYLIPVHKHICDWDRKERLKNTKTQTTRHIILNPRISLLRINGSKSSWKAFNNRISSPIITSIFSWYLELVWKNWNLYRWRRLRQKLLG